MMKIAFFSLLMLSCLAYHVRAQTEADYRQKAQACIQEQKLSDADVKLLADDKWNTNPSKDLKCFFACLYKKIGVIDAAGKPNVDLAMKYMNSRYSGQADKVKASLVECAKLKSADACESVYNIESCMVKAMKA